MLTNKKPLVNIHVNAYDLKFKGAASVNGMEIYYFEDKQEVYTDFTQQRFAEIMRIRLRQQTVSPSDLWKAKKTAVVRNTTMPAVLIETAYITNKEDNDRLNSQEFREKTAGGIADGIVAAMEEIGVFKHDGEMYVFKETGE